jgi:hypothetical protein
MKANWLELIRALRCVAWPQTAALRKARDIMTPSIPVFMEELDFLTPTLKNQQDY